MGMRLECFLQFLPYRLHLVIDALLAIQSGQNPRVIEAMLKAYLPESQRDAEAAGDAAEA